MACILCYVSKDDIDKDAEDFYGIYDYNENTGMSAIELIKTHISNLSDVSEIQYLNFYFNI
jgi:hypothetical protein